MKKIVLIAVLAAGYLMNFGIGASGAPNTRTTFASITADTIPGGKRDSLRLLKDSTNNRDSLRRGKDSMGRKYQHGDSLRMKRDSSYGRRKDSLNRKQG